MDIILHLGAHRCASTTLQSFLGHNRCRLAGRGLTCWTPKRTRDGLMRGLMCHPALATALDEQHQAQSVRLVRREIERLARENQNALLISEENLIGSMRNNILDGRLYPLLQERLRRIAPALEDRPLKIGLCIRSYDEYWTSCLAYRISKGGSHPSGEQLAVLAGQTRRWRDVIRDVATAFDSAEITVWSFEDMASRPDAQLGLMWDGDTAGLEHADIWRNRANDIVQLNKTLSLRGEAPLQNGLMSTAQRWTAFDKEQRHTLRAEYRRDVEWLSNGADGLARYADGWPTPATRPDRADVTHTAVSYAAFLRGRTDGIEERLERTGTS